MGYNNLIILARAPVDDVSQALCDLHVGAVCFPNVLNCKVRLAENAFFVFRMRGHQWTEMLLSDNLSDTSNGFALSKQLNCAVILYVVTDTCGAIGYSYWLRGELVEWFEDIGGKRVIESKRRRLTSDHIENGWDFVAEFLEEQEAVDPYFRFESFLGRADYKVGEIAVLRSPRHRVMRKKGPTVIKPRIERLDYISLPA